MLATITSLAAAQGVEVTHDSTDTTHAGTVQQRQGRNWFVSLLHKIARRSDDSITTDEGGTFGHWQLGGGVQLGGFFIESQYKSISTNNGNSNHVPVLVGWNWNF